MSPLFNFRNQDPMIRILDGTPIVLTADGESDGWFQVAVEGEWEGHWMGPFALDKAMFKQMVVHRRASAIDTVVDYEHATLYAFYAPASGWELDLDIRTFSGMDTLWAKIDWTDAAAADIRAKRYKYLSPVIQFSTRDRRSGRLMGASIPSIALTNTPFLEELPELRLNSLGADKLRLDIRRAALIGGLTEEEKNMDEQQLMELLRELSLGSGTPFNQVLDRVRQLLAVGREQQVLRQQLGLSTGSTHQQVIGEVFRLQQTQPNNDELVELRRQLAERDRRDAEAAAHAAVLQAQKEGKVLAEGTENFQRALSYAQQDLGGFQSLMASMPTIVPVERVEHATQREGQDDHGLSKRQRIACRNLGLKPESLMKWGRRKSEEEVQP